MGDQTGCCGQLIEVSHKLDIGTFHAYYAAQKGYKTFLIERNIFPNDASTRNFGMIVRSIVDTTSEWAEFARTSAEIYQSIQQEHDIAVKVTGSLYMASTETKLRVVQEFAQAFSPRYRCLYLDADEACHRYPFIRASYCKGALLFPDDLTIDPGRMLRQLIPYIGQTSMIDYIQLTTEAVVEPSGQGCVVKDTKGNIFTAARVIICSGADYRTLFPEHFLLSGLQICKLQMMQTVTLHEGISIGCWHNMAVSGRKTGKLHSGQGTALPRSVLDATRTRSSRAYRRAASNTRPKALVRTVTSSSMR